MVATTYIFATTSVQDRTLTDFTHLLDASTKQQVYLGLVDILFAHAYNHRTTEGDNTVSLRDGVTRLSEFVVAEHLVQIQTSLFIKHRNTIELKSEINVDALG